MAADRAEGFHGSDTHTGLLSNTSTLKSLSTLRSSAPEPQEMLEPKHGCSRRTPKDCSTTKKNARLMHFMKAILSFVRSCISLVTTEFEFRPEESTLHLVLNRHPGKPCLRAKNVKDTVRSVIDYPLSKPSVFSSPRSSFSTGWPNALVSGTRTTICRPWLIHRWQARRQCDRTPGRT